LNIGYWLLPIATANYQNAFFVTPFPSVI
jgi:hypothetical protein